MLITEKVSAAHGFVEKFHAAFGEAGRLPGQDSRKGWARSHLKPEWAKRKMVNSLMAGTR